MAVSAGHAVVPEGMAGNRNDLCQGGLTLRAEIRSLLRDSATADCLREPMITAVSLLSWQGRSAPGTNGDPISQGKKPTELPG